MLDKARVWLQRKHPFVLFHEPNEDSLKAVFQHDSILHKFKGLDDEGFVFAPFDSNQDSLFTKGTFCEENLELNGIEESSRKLEFSEKGREAHIKLVEDAIEELRSERLQKVVLSRVTEKETEKSSETVFVSLLKKYQSAFCYWWYHPAIGMWMGATPEQLLKYNGFEIALSSLAGTLPYVKGESPNWTPKEIEEQQLVTDYIKSALQDNVYDLNVSEPVSTMAGKLWHLKSMITGKLNATRELSSIIKIVHPTPAVCGLPKEKSFQYIVQNENHDREFYSGFLGPINLGSTKGASLFVNLRCLKYREGKAKIYIGGGITAASNALKEWQETQLKSRTILAVL